MLLPGERGPRSAGAYIERPGRYDPARAVLNFWHSVVLLPGQRRVEPPEERGAEEGRQRGEERVRVMPGGESPARLFLILR